ncbi:MAG: cysteine--tRNA ligase [Tabrizicola sp.]|uniref:cysteine--tRNA ligase n=1 Tax=Tabrizicola sp. TaxID=2005166 RepID=UPI0027345172|nr:cysteine--tRNA ligase [Tabrizicola sp.]MDP3263282.1 cysteine--tRNA ligase [Tabrizicola sp.]MDP3646639.1 cysteine--tRNA ligase [Paracoccaceae bacterium]MDZ4065767.1 cysteine--tRNA ligase [Tabrizicola sp.]
MTGLRLYNTKARAKQDFAPIDASNVRMYVCGPTVYDRAHLGNARPVVVFDTLYRLLRHLYGPDHVTYVRNFTDVDDKINAEALRRQKAGAPGTLEDLIHQRTEETIAWYHADMDALRALRPNIEPRATEFIAQMIAMTEGLIASGHAYEASGHVLFAVESYAAYGKLSGRSVDDMIAGARVEVAPYKRNPMDFVLWKPSSGQEPGWDSPWGRGRPGWHIECSAMAHELLGESFDIHGGGLDLQFPHHENEIAQSACAHPHGDFAHYWLHNEMLQVEGKKMSKSLGNFFTVRDLLDQGIPGEVIRFVFLMTHYRSPMDWTAEKARQALDEISFWANTLSGRPDALDEQPAMPLPDTEIVDAISDDLNTSLALARLQNLGRFIDNSTDYLNLTAEAQLAADLKFIASAEFLGFPVRTLAALKRQQGLSLAGLKLRLASLREAAMATKDFSAVDALKSALIAAGVEVRMSKAGVELVPGPDFDPAKLEAIQ